MTKLLNGERASDLFIPIGSKRPAAGLLRSAGSAAGGARAKDFKCSQPPDTTPQSENYYYTLETDQAAKLGITYIGAGNLDVDRKMKVYIREFSKYNTCESTDGGATLKYGAVWRATVLIDQTDASGNLTFPMVAASATLKNLSVQVSVTTQGFKSTDQVGIDRAGQAAMEATKGGLNVSSFAKFAEALEKSIQLAIDAKVATPLSLIGIKVKGTDELSESVARAFAIACAADGRSLQDALGAFPVKNTIIDQAIRDTYSKLRKQDNDEIVRIRAQQLVKGVRIPLKEWYQVWK